MGWEGWEGWMGEEEEIRKELFRLKFTWKKNQINHSLIQTNCVCKRNPILTSPFFVLHPPPRLHFLILLISNPTPSYPLLPPQTPRLYLPSKPYISRRHCHIDCLWHRLPVARGAECTERQHDVFRTETGSHKELHPLLSPTLSSIWHLLPQPGWERHRRQIAASAEASHAAASSIGRRKSGHRQLWLTVCWERSRVWMYVSWDRLSTDPFHEAKGWPV